MARFVNRKKRTVKRHEGVVFMTGEEILDGYDNVAAKGSVFSGGVVIVRRAVPDQPLKVISFSVISPSNM